MVSYSRNIYLDESYAVGHASITDSIIDKKIYVVMLHLNKKVGLKKKLLCAIGRILLILLFAVHYTVVSQSGLPVWGGASGL